MVAGENTILFTEILSNLQFAPICSYKNLWHRYSVSPGWGFLPPPPPLNPSFFQPIHFMWLGFHVAEPELSIQQHIPWVTRTWGRQRTCVCNPGRRLHPNKYPAFPVCHQGSKGQGNKQLLMLEGLHCWRYMRRQQKRR